LTKKQTFIIIVRRPQYLRRRQSGLSKHYPRLTLFAKDTFMRVAARVRTETAFIAGYDWLCS